MDTRGEERARLMGREEVLLSLDRSLAHGVQIELWEADLKAFDKLKADDEEELRRVRGQAYQGLTLSAVYVGGFVKLISQANLLPCKLWWYPVALSVAVFLATFLAIAERLHRMGELTEDIDEMGANISALMEQRDKIEEWGAAIDLDTAQPFAYYHREKRAGCYFKGSRGGIFGLLLLTCFYGFFICFAVRSLRLHCYVCAVASSPRAS